MKSVSNKTGKHKAFIVMTAMKQSCGTLSHLADCRGVSRKIDTIVRKDALVEIATGISGKRLVVR